MIPPVVRTCAIQVLKVKFFKTNYCVVSCYCINDDTSCTEIPSTNDTYINSTSTSNTQQNNHNNTLQGERCLISFHNENDCTIIRNTIQSYLLVRNEKEQPNQQQTDKIDEYTVSSFHPTKNNSTSSTSNHSCTDTDTTSIKTTTISISDIPTGTVVSSSPPKKTIIIEARNTGKSNNVHLSNNNTSIQQSSNCNSSKRRSRRMQQHNKKQTSDNNNDESFATTGSTGKYNTKVNDTTNWITISSDILAEVESTTGTISTSTYNNNDNDNDTTSLLVFIILQTNTVQQTINRNRHGHILLDCLQVLYIGNYPNMIECKTEQTVNTHNNDNKIVNENNNDNINNNNNNNNNDRCSNSDIVHRISSTSPSTGNVNTQLKQQYSSISEQQSVHGEKNKMNDMLLFQDKSKRHQLFAQWIVQQYGYDYLTSTVHCTFSSSICYNNGKINDIDSNTSTNSSSSCGCCSTSIIDVAGGNGELIYELIQLGISNIVLIDPNPRLLNNTKVLDCIMKHKNTIRIIQYGLNYNNTRQPTATTDDDDSTTTNFLLYNNTIRSTEEEEEIEEQDTTYTCRSTEYTSLLVSFNTKEEYEQYFINNIIKNCKLIVGMHPDQATESIILLANTFHIPFAIVPCCVMPKLFPQRYIINTNTNDTIANTTTSNENEQQQKQQQQQQSPPQRQVVRSYNTFCQYLMNMGTDIYYQSIYSQSSSCTITKNQLGQFYTAYLPFWGRNTIIYSKRNIE